MTNETQLPELPIELGPRSSVFEKTTPELRRKLDRAILNYDPPGYRALYKKYGLPELGVSFTAFYYYARRLRRRAAAADMALTALPDERDSVRLLPGLVGQCLIDQLMTGDDASPQAIYRLMLAYTAAINNAITVHEARHVFPRNAPPSPPLPHSDIPLPTSSNPVNPAHLSNDELLALSERVLADEKNALAQEKESLAAEQAQLAAEFEQAKKDFVAMGYPVAECKNLDEVEDIIRSTKPSLEQPPPAAGSTNDSLTVLSVPEVPSVPSTRDSSSQISNPEISNPAAPSPSIPHSEFPLPTSPNPVNPVNPVHSPSADALTSTADDQFRITPEERRRREFLRVALAYGLIKPDAPVPDGVVSIVKTDCPTK